MNLAKIFFAGRFQNVGFPSANFMKTDPLAGAFAASVGAVEKTASGAVASFTTALSKPLKSLVANIDPVQDLHGMPYPYPAGGSKNLIPDGTDTSNGFVSSKYLLADGTLATSANCYVSEYFPVTADAMYTYSTNVNSLTGVCFYDANKDYISGVALTNNKVLTVTAPSSAVYARASYYLRTTAYIAQFELGDTATDLMYYSNVCPIEGWTGANVGHTGQNLLIPSFFTSNGMTQDASVPNAFSGRIALISGKDMLYGAYADGVYTIKGTMTGSLSVNVEYRDGSNTLVATSSVASGYTTSAQKTVKKISVYNRGGASATTTITDLLIVRGADVPTEYSALGGVTPVSWQTEAGTVYGGSLDVTTGVLTVEWANIASYDGEVLPGEWISDRDVYAPGTTPTTGAQVCYKLATPLTVQLTAQQISTLKGQNNIWADTGDVAVTYLDKR